MQSLGLVFSRFDFNELPNRKCVPGSFQLDVDEIGLYRSVRPAIVLVSSAGTERYESLVLYCAVLDLVMADFTLFTQGQ